MFNSHKTRFAHGDFIAKFSVQGPIVRNNHAAHTSDTAVLSGVGGGGHFALRPRKRGVLLGTGTGGEGDERVKARPRIPPEKDRRDRGPPPEQWQCYGGVPSPLPSDLCTTPQIAVSTALLGQSHKDNVRCTAVEEQPEAKEVQLAQPSSISLLMISSGLT